jgi:hypothetical protein
MNFSIAQIIARLWAPRHEISCSWFLWQRLCARLRERGRNATRESGAFLLAARANDRTRITDFILYDDLDPHALDSASCISTAGISARSGTSASSAA